MAFIRNGRRLSQQELLEFIALGVSGRDEVKGEVVNVPTAGEAVQLPSFECREVTVIAKLTNNGPIYVGGSDVSSTVYGVQLEAKDSYTFVVSNANAIWVDAGINGEGVSYVAL